MRTDKKNILSSGDKRSRIIKAAAEVFSRKGFHQATVEEISEKAAVGKGTVYAYFKNKKELFLEMILYTREKFLQRMREEIAQADSFHNRLKNMFEATVKFLLQHREMTQMLIADSPPLTEDLHQLLLEKDQEWFEQLLDLLQEATERGEIRPLNKSAAVYIINGALAMLGSRMILYEEDLDYEQLALDFTDIIYHGLK